MTWDDRIDGVITGPARNRIEKLDEYDLIQGRRLPMKDQRDETTLTVERPQRTMHDATVVIRTMLDDEALIDAVNEHGQLLFVRHVAAIRPTDDRLTCSRCQTFPDGGRCPDCGEVWRGAFGYPNGYDPQEALTADLTSLQERFAALTENEAPS